MQYSDVGADAVTWCRQDGTPSAASKWAHQWPQHVTDDDAVCHLAVYRWDSAAAAAAADAVAVAAAERGAERRQRASASLSVSWRTYERTNGRTVG